jgi:hypothetical protein
MSAVERQRFSLVPKVPANAAMAELAARLVMSAAWAHNPRMVAARQQVQSAAYALMALAMSAASAFAAPDCQCVSKGQRVDLGTVICLEVSPSVRYLARCERVLNNTSWKKLDEGCPSARLCIPDTTVERMVHAG